MATPQHKDAKEAMGTTTKDVPAVKLKDELLSKELHESTDTDLSHTHWPQELAHETTVWETFLRHAIKNERGMLQDLNATDLTLVNMASSKSQGNLDFAQNIPDGLAEQAMDMLPSCGVCEKPITLHAISAFGQVFHGKCFTCKHCGKPHDSNACWQKFPHLPRQD